MSKKHKDISTYFILNKKSKGDDIDNDLQQSTINNLNNTDCNSESDILNNEQVLAGTSSSLVDQNYNDTNNVLVDLDDIGLYVINNTAKYYFLLLNRLLTKPFIPPTTFIFPMIEQNGKNRSVCQHSWLTKYS